MSSGKGTIKERLVCIETFLKDFKQSTNDKIDDCKDSLDNHLQHHFWINITLLGAIITEAIALLVIAIKHIL